MLPSVLPGHAPVEGLARRWKGGFGAGARRALGRGPLGRLALLGPAFVAAVAYVDPGNVATNVAGGARYGYQLVWVVVAANLMAILVQYLSAKLGLATGQSLAELCRDSFPRLATVLLWAQAEAVAMATDVAEFVGAALGLNLLFGVPLFPAGLITAVVSLGVLAFGTRGQRRLEVAVLALLALVALGLLYDLFALGGQSASGVAAGLVPHLTDRGALTLAVGIIGATVMPHVVYLHSALTLGRRPSPGEEQRRSALRWLRLDCGLALGLAGVINLVMLCLAVALLSGHGDPGNDSILLAHRQLEQQVGGVAAMTFAVALLASGISSASVGTLAGQVVMQGFLRRSVPLFLRRSLTMLPALLVLALGLPTTATLVLSQVVLSFGIPFAIVPLVLFTARSSLMGSYVNRRLTTVAAAAVAAVIVALNGWLIVAAL